MSTFGPDPEHRFAFGLRTIGHCAGALAAEPVEPWEFVYRLGDIGAWGVGFHDDDLVPVGASPSERDDILDKVAKALDSTGMVVSIASANLSGHPVFGHGAFTSADRDVRRYAIQKAMRAIDLGAELGAELHELSGRAKASESIAAKPSVGRPRPLPRGGRLPCGYACEQGYPARFALRSTTTAATRSADDRARAGVHRHARPSRDGRARPGDRPRERRRWCHGVAQAIEAGKLFHAPPRQPQPAGARLPARQAARGVRLRRPAALRRRSGLLRRRRRDVGLHRRLHAHLPRARRQGEALRRRSRDPRRPGGVRRARTGRAERRGVLGGGRAGAVDGSASTWRSWCSAAPRPALDQLVIDLVLGLR